MERSSSGGDGDHAVLVGYGGASRAKWLANSCSAWHLGAVAGACDLGLKLREAALGHPLHI